MRDLGFNAVILGAPLMQTCARERCPPTAVLKAMLAKGSVKFGLGMKLGRMEGAKEVRPARHLAPPDAPCCARSPP